MSKTCAHCHRLAADHSLVLCEHCGGPLELPRKKCRCCSESIAPDASICPQCHSNQSPWKQFARVENLSVIVTFLTLVVTAGMMWLSYEQWKDAKHQRAEAADALERAKKAESSVLRSEGALKVIVRRVEETDSRIKSIRLAAEASEHTLAAMVRDTQSRVGSLHGLASRANEEVVRLRGSQSSIAKDINVLKDRTNAEIREAQTLRHYSELADRAIAKGDRQSFDQLMEMYRSQRPEEPGYDALVANIMRTKSYWLLVNRVPTDTLTRHGKTIKASDLTTCELIDELDSNPTWEIRALMAKTLTRKEKGVPEALLRAIKTDRHIHVVRDAIRTWAVVTGFASSDVLDVEPIETWWKENQDKTVARLAVRFCVLSIEK